MQKSSKYRGVSLCKRSGKWRSQIVVDERPVYLGIYDSEVEAALAFDEEAYLLYGSEARLNFAKSYALSKPKKPNRQSAFQGVSWSKSDNKWSAALVVDGHATPLGLFDDEFEAAVAVDEALIRVSNAKDIRALKRSKS